MAGPDRRRAQFAEVRRFVGGVYGADLHAKRIDSLAGATLGVMQSASLAVAMIGQALGIHPVTAALPARAAIRSRSACLVLDRGIPTEAHRWYLVGTPKGRLSRLEEAAPRQALAGSPNGQLLSGDDELYVFAKNADRASKERRCTGGSSGGCGSGCES